MAGAARALLTTYLPAVSAAAALAVLTAMPAAGVAEPRHAPAKTAPPAPPAAPAQPAAAAPNKTIEDAHRRAPPLNELGRPPKPAVAGPLRIPDAQLEPVTWSSLDHWADDNHAAAFAVFAASCRPIVAQAAARTDSRRMVSALADVCRRALALKAPDSETARTFFEDNFEPVRIGRLGDGQGFLTGYFEPVVEGSRFPTQEFKVPVYRRPPDLVPPPGVSRGQGFPNTGRAMRRTPDGALVPYYDRGQIEDGALAGRHLEICWIKDPIDLLFMQIQGSARVRLEDGAVVRLNYDAHNGYPYTAIGRVLVERKLVPREDMSMERIRQWMIDHPRDAKELRAQNKAYVFFRVAGLSDENDQQQPVGAQGLPLTPRRSIAIDKALHVYGTPFFIEANLPIATPTSDTRFRRLMIGQDTGSAITGPARADLFFGTGDEAGKVAGRIRNPARFTLLLPRALDLVEAGRHFPLPPTRPDVEAIVAAQERAAAAARKAQAQSQPESQVPVPRVRPARGAAHPHGRRRQHGGQQAGAED